MKIGTRVVTTADCGARDWSAPGVRRWNEAGVIVRISDAHGSVLNKEK